MEYQKIINFLVNTPNQPSKLKTKNWVERNYGSYGLYNTVNPIKFKTLLIRSKLCDHSDAYILFKETITVPNSAAADSDPNNRNKKVTFKNYAPFTDCISEITNKEIDHAKYINVVMPMYNLI